MANRTLTGGNDTSRIPNTADEAAAREARQTAARNVISGIVADQHPGARDGDPDNPSPALLAAARDRAELYAALGLDGER